ncbi:MAG: alpha/beta fold hydrolase [Allorhizobium sp.]
MPQDKMISNGAIQISAQCFGSTGDEPIVLVMGATASMLWWPEALCRMLAEAGHHVIRYDNRDTGRSTTGRSGEVAYTIEDMADDLFAVMDGYELPAAHVAGMSLGGFIGQMAALMRPQRVKSLTLIGSQPLGGADEPLPGISDRFTEHFARLADLDWSDRPAVSDFLLESARLSAGSGHAFDKAAARARIEAEIARAIDMKSAFNHGMVSTRENWDGRISDIACPVLVIHGDEDPVLPLPNGEAIARLVPGAKLSILEGTGHELHDGDLEQIACEMTRFIGGQKGD